METRLVVWQRLATDMKPAHLDRIAQEITLDRLDAAFATLMNGQARGRFVVKL